MQYGEGEKNQAVDVQSRLETIEHCTIETHHDFLSDLAIAYITKNDVSGLGHAHEAHPQYFYTVADTDTILNVIT